MKKINFAILFFVFLSFVPLIYFGCKKDKNDSSNINSNSTTLTIKVMDKQSNPLGNANVTCYDKSGSTSSDGKLTLSGVSVPDSDKERMVIQLEKEAYFAATVGAKPNLGSETYFEAVMSEAELAGTVNNNTGGIVTNSNGTIFMDFPPNSLAYPDGTPFSGDANIYTAYHSPDEENFALSMPGGSDMVAINSNGEEGSMISFGAISVEAKTPDMKSLQLNGMKSSNVQVNSQIPNSMLVEATATIPIWRLNEETAVWEEIGTGYKQGNRYEYEVDHFSSINCDFYVPPPTTNFDGALTLVKGDVCDDSLNPLPFARVDVWQRTVFANEVGHFEVYLPSNRVYTFESEYCTKTAGPFVLGQENIVDLCCEGNENPGFFKISVDGLYQGQAIDEDFEFTTFGYMFVDTTGYFKLTEYLILWGGGVDQYWANLFGFYDISLNSTFHGLGTYSLNYYSDFEAFPIIEYFPNLDTNNMVIFWPNSGTMNISEYVEGGKLSGSFTLAAQTTEGNVNLNGEFEVYEMEMKKQEAMKNKYLNLNSFLNKSHNKK